MVAGVGNIFRAEVLFEIGLNPRTRGCEIPRATFDGLWRSLRKMMKTGLRYGRIIAVSAAEAGRPLAQVDGQDRFRVYQRTECPRCGGPISNIELAARKLYLCAHCQSN